eukprot:scaffold12924_cov125-Isochrysis_galbana.AAC.11
MKMRLAAARLVLRMAVFYVLSARVRVFIIWMGVSWVCGEAGACLYLYISINIASSRRTVVCVCLEKAAGACHNNAITSEF